MSKLLVVDGMNLLFRMFYGMPARIVNADGKAIQGTLGFVGALLKILRAISPTHVAVIFDGECENERRDIDKDYKANRPDYSQMAEDELPFSQLPDVYAALDLLGIPLIEHFVFSDRAFAPILQKITPIESEAAAASSIFDTIKANFNKPSKEDSQ